MAAAQGGLPALPFPFPLTAASQPADATLTASRPAADGSCNHAHPIPSGKPLSTLGPVPVQEPPEQAPSRPDPQQEAARVLSLQAVAGPERADVASTGIHTVPMGRRPPAKVRDS